MPPGLFITIPITNSMYGVTFNADIPRWAKLYRASDSELQRFTREFYPL